MLSPPVTVQKKNTYLRPANKIGSLSLEGLRQFPMPDGYSLVPLGAIRVAPHCRTCRATRRPLRNHVVKVRRCQAKQKAVALTPVGCQDRLVLPLDLRQNNSFYASIVCEVYHTDFTVASVTSGN